MDVDSVLRKEVFDNCVTPSLPNGINAEGKALTIYDLEHVQLGEPLANTYKSRLALPNNGKYGKLLTELQAKQHIQNQM